MAQNIFTIDGRDFDVRIPQDGIKRSGQVLDSAETERLENGEMFRDIIGTYYNYTIQVDTKNLKVEEYDELYDLVTQPVEKHTITVPYGQTTLSFDAYITSAEDSLLKRENGVNYWHGLTLAFIALKPNIIA